ncbi:hypothetical protein AZE42_12543 [Rhizopogon vesiculosus]|uniref:Uncharacterized protein n=1 Tax=Rhizopogon vesiculosus TaxID=180088 RepID=A0A1J8QFU9_9AGAM|nr:hypothetical protein AZE42_12543 [Rhizopogon vesiculosus]
MFFTPSGSQFSIAKHGTNREGCETQYDKAKIEESGPGAGKMYTLIDTNSSTMYYFRAERAPTVCIFTGREGGLGRFVLCSERCNVILGKKILLVLRRCPSHARARCEHSRHLSIGGLEYKLYYISTVPVLLLSSLRSTTTNIISPPSYLPPAYRDWSIRNSQECRSQTYLSTNSESVTDFEG